jgi:hypothetical protein
MAAAPGFPTKYPALRTLPTPFLSSNVSVPDPSRSSASPSAATPQCSLPPNVLTWLQLWRSRKLVGSIYSFSALTRSFTGRQRVGTTIGETGGSRPRRGAYLSCHRTASFSRSRKSIGPSSIWTQQAMVGVRLLRDGTGRVDDTHPTRKLRITIAARAAATGSDETSGQYDGDWFHSSR